MRLKSTIFCILIILFCFGCVGAKHKDVKILPIITEDDGLTLFMDKEEIKQVPSIHTKESKEIKESVPQDIESTSKIKEISLKEIPILQTEEIEKKDQELYTFTMRDADIRSLLLSFSKKSQYSIVLDPNVKGLATMDLKEVTLEDALDNILTPLGYKYKKDGNIIKIYKPKLETRSFTLNYLTTVREGKTTVEAKSPGGVEGIGSQAAAVTNTETVDLWAEIENGLKGLISNKGRLSINKLASIVVVTDYVDNLDKISEFLENVMDTVKRQVLIEASIIEVILSDDYQMGLDWTHLIGREDPSKYINIDQTTTGRLTSSVFRVSFQWSNIDALLEAISEQGNINIISRPRITTLNNQKAIIKVGTEEVYFELEEETETGSPSKTKYNTKFFTVGLVLDVTPQIGPSDEITLHIHPVFSEKTEDRPSPSGGTVPIVSIRESSAVVKVKSGHTMILGGLMMEKNTIKTSGIPGLMHIPFLRPFFSYTNKMKQKTELVVTLTPKIIHGKEMEEFTNKELQKILGENTGISKN